MQDELPDNVYPIPASLKEAWIEYSKSGINAKDPALLKSLQIVFNHGGLFVYNMIANAMNTAKGWEDILVVMKPLKREFAAFQAWVQQEAAKQRDQKN